MNRIEERAKVFSLHYKILDSKQKKEIAEEAYIQGAYDMLRQIECRAIYSSKGILEYIRELKS